jgi:hypothetical protein
MWVVPQPFDSKSYSYGSGIWKVNSTII